MVFAKIGAAVMICFSMVILPATAHATDSSTNNSSDAADWEQSQAIQIDEAEQESDSTGQNTMEHASAPLLNNQLVKSGVVNEYGFHPDFYQWLVDHGTLPRGAVTQADLDEVTRIDHIIYAPFSSLEGIEQFKNLNFLRINSCANISYEELNRLSGLTHLRTLDISFNKLMTDISPVANIPQLTTLMWNNNGGYIIGHTYYYGAPLDISVLSGQLPNIESLSIYETPLLGTEILATFTTAKNVNLWSTGLKNIDFITAMPALKSLDVRFNKVSDLSLAVARPEVVTEAGGQLIVRYGDEELYTDLTQPSTFDTSMYFKITSGEYLPLSGISTAKGSYDDAETITWADVTADDLLGITYKDPLTMQRVSLQTVASQFSATSLPLNIKSYSGTIYQSISQAIDVEEPVIDDIYEDEILLTGIAPAGVDVDVTCPHGITTRVTADASGQWSMPTDGVINDGDTFTAVTVHSSGQTSDTVEQVVKPVIYTIEASDVTMTVTQLQTLRQNGTLETYVLQQAGATAEKNARVVQTLEVHADMTPLENINQPAVTQVTTYVPANSSNVYDMTNTLAEQQINVIVIDTSGTNGDNNQGLPGTGQDLVTPILFGGTGTIIAVIILVRTREKKRE